MIRFRSNDMTKPIIIKLMDQKGGTLRVFNSDHPRYDDILQSLNKAYVVSDMGTYGVTLREFNYQMKMCLAFMTAKNMNEIALAVAKNLLPDTEETLANEQL